MIENFNLKQCPFCGNKPNIEKRKVKENIDCRPNNYVLVGVWCNTCWFGLCNAVHNEKDIENVLQENIQRWNTRKS